MRTIYHLRNATYSYNGQFSAIRGISMEISAPSRIALIGSNGSGKSTLLKLLNALYFPQSGSLAFDSIPLTEEKMSDDVFSFAFRRRVGLLFQDPDVQLFSPTVWDEICFGPLQLQWEKERVRECAETILREFDLGSLRDRTPHHLSGGEKKKVALASVLVMDPEILLLDEPTAGLDPRTQSVLLELLQEWGRREKTIITSTHDLTIVREICDYIHILQDGLLVAGGAPEEILANGPLLEETNLVHRHTHRHRDVEHRHAHTHDLHGHDHGHE